MIQAMAYGCESGQTQDQCVSTCTTGHFMCNAVKSYICTAACSTCE